MFLIQLSRPADGIGTTDQARAAGHPAEAAVRQGTNVEAFCGIAPTRAGEPARTRGA